MILYGYLSYDVMLRVIWSVFTDGGLILMSMMTKVWIAPPADNRRMSSVCIRTYLWGAVDLGAVVREVVVGLLLAYRLQLRARRKTGKLGPNIWVDCAVVGGGVSSHHVIPQADSHLSVSSLAEVEAVHREEGRICFTHLVEKAAVLKRRRWFRRIPVAAR